MSAPYFSRRSFVGAGVACAAALGAGGIELALGQSEAAYVRPPGAASNKALVSSCNRCDRCVQACPYGIVVRSPLGDGLVTYGTPVLDFTHGRCDFCMKCTEACPTGALSFGTLNERDVGVAVVVSDACVAWSWSGCTVCRDKCPVDGAITLDAQGRPIVHPDYCDGCGTCEHECPSASLRSYDSSILDKGIVVVSRASVAAEAQGALSSEELRANRTAPANSTVAPHDKGVHLDGPDGTRTAGGSHEDE